jgi:hypothetical protein
MNAFILGGIEGAHLAHAVGLEQGLNPLLFSRLRLIRATQPS